MSGLWMTHGAQKPFRGSGRVALGAPVASGLSRLWTFDNAHTDQTIRDYVVGDVLTNTRNQADTRVVSSDLGYVYEAGASAPSNYIGGATTSRLGADSLTVILRYKHHTSNGFLDATTYVVSGNPTGSWVPRLRVTTSAFTFTAVRGGTGEHGSTLAVAPVAGTWYTVVGRYVRNTNIATYAGTWQVCVNGQWSTANNSTVLTAFPGTFDSTPWFFQHDSQSGGNSNHLFYDYAAIWHRALSDAECAAITAEPFVLVTR